MPVVVYEFMSNKCLPVQLHTTAVVCAFFIYFAFIIIYLIPDTVAMMSCIYNYCHDSSSATTASPPIYNMMMRVHAGAFSTPVILRIRNSN